MQLREVPRRSFVKIAEEDWYEVLFFDHIDGMYSLCFDKEGNYVHIAAWTNVEITQKPDDWDVKSV